MARTSLKIAVFCGAISWLCAAQERKSEPEFEVVSVKLAPPPVPFSVALRLRYSRIDAGRFEAAEQPLTWLISFAYGTGRISGPNWMREQYFTVMAKLPAGSTKEQVPAMLQKLLADRFGLIVHHDQKAESVYELVADKKGVKLKLSVPAKPGNGCSSWPGQVFCQGSTLGQFSQFLSGLGNRGARMSSTTPPGELLEQQIDRPVIDQTGLAGVYDIDLQWVPPAGLDDTQSRIEYPGRPPRNPAVKAGSIFGALEAVGLKLQSVKHAFDILVVDHVERVPSEN